MSRKTGTVCLEAEGRGRELAGTGAPSPKTFSTEAQNRSITAKVPPIGESGSSGR